MRGINPKYLDKLDDAQRDFILSGPGKKFFDEFLCRHGNHVFVVGTTGSGKTKKGIHLLNYLKLTETQVWISSGKQDVDHIYEIMPLFCLGMKIRIVIPKGAEFKIEEHGPDGWGPIRHNPPDIVEIPKPESAWSAIKISYDEQRHKKYDTITIFEFRNTIKKSAQPEWMTRLFESLSEGAREGTLPAILPASIHCDETKWFIAGSRITTDQGRTKSAEMVTENATEIRSAGGRLIFYEQAYTNITPASRENMQCTIINRGTNITTDQNPRLAELCRKHQPSSFKRHQGIFVFEDGSTSPTDRPWLWPNYPKSEEDQKWIRKIRITYGKKYDGTQTEQEIIQEECLPDLGVYAALAIPPEKQAEIISRWQSEGVITNGD
jgi:hypothetical protein